MLRKPPPGPSATRQHQSSSREPVRGRAPWNAGASHANSASSPKPLATGEQHPRHARSRSVERSSLGRSVDGKPAVVVDRRAGAVVTALAATSQKPARQRTHSVSSLTKTDGLPSNPAVSATADIHSSVRVTDSGARHPASENAIPIAGHHHHHQSTAVGSRRSVHRVGDHAIAVRAKHAERRQLNNSNGGSSFGEAASTDPPAAKGASRSHVRRNTGPVRGMAVRSMASFAPSFPLTNNTDPPSPPRPDPHFTTEGWDGSMGREGADRGGWLFVQPAAESPEKQRSDRNTPCDGGSSTTAPPGRANPVPESTASQRPGWSSSATSVHARVDSPPWNSEPQREPDTRHERHGSEQDRPGLRQGRREASSRGARVSELEHQVESLQRDNQRLTGQLKNMKDLYEQLTQSSDLPSDRRCTSLLKSQVYQLKRQVLLLSSALAKRASLMQETANTVEQVVTVLSHCQAESQKATAGDGSVAPRRNHAMASHRNGPASAQCDVCIPRSDLDDMLHSACHTHARITKGFESGCSAPELDTALVFMSPFLRKVKCPVVADGDAELHGNGSGSVGSGEKTTRYILVQPTLLDVCSGSLKHLNLKHVGRLESSLSELCGNLIQLQAALRKGFADAPSQTPTVHQLRASRANTETSSQDSARCVSRILNDSSGASDRSTGHRELTSPPPLPVPSSQSPVTVVNHLSLPLVSSRTGHLLEKACSGLSRCSEQLLQLSLLVPAAPFPSLENTELPVADWSSDVIISQLPPNMRHKHELGKQLEGLTKAVKYSLMMKDKQLSSLEEELACQRQIQQQCISSTVQFMEAVRHRVCTLEGNVTVQFGHPLQAVLVAYGGLKLNPTEESLRWFVQTFKEQESELSEAVSSLEQGGQHDSFSPVLSEFMESTGTLCQSLINQQS